MVFANAPYPRFDVHYWRVRPWKAMPLFGLYCIAPVCAKGDSLQPPFLCLLSKAYPFFIFHTPTLTARVARLPFLMSQIFQTLFFAAKIFFKRCQSAFCSFHGLSFWQIQIPTTHPVCALSGFYGWFYNDFHHFEINFTYVFLPNFI